MSLSRFAFFVMVFLSVLVALASSRLFFTDISLSFPGMAGQIQNSLSAFVAHVIAASVALALGAFQFFAGVRARRPTLHRWVGRLYALCVLVGGLSGFAMAFVSNGGVIAGLGFALLACLWILTTAVAVNHARAKRIDLHRRWMLRSFSLAFAGVTLRLQLQGFALAGMPYAEASVILAWSCWLPNLLAVEWWLRTQVARRSAKA